MSTTQQRGGVSRQVVVYGLGNVAVAALNFALFAVYARVLLPADYGAMSLIVTVCSAVSMLGMLGVNNAVQRFFFDDPSDTAQRRVWGSGFVGTLTWTTVLASLVALVSLGLGGRVPRAVEPAVLLALAAVLPQVVLIWLQDEARLRFRPWRYALLALAQALMSGVAGVLFVVFFRWGVKGFFAGTLVGATLTAVVAWATAARIRPLEVSREEFRRLAAFGAPFVPAAVAIWASVAVLRWLLAPTRGLEEAGLFDVAWKLAAPVWMLNAAVGQAFGPYAFRLRAENPEYRSRLVDTFHLIGVVTLIAAAAVGVFAREICLWIAPPSYAGAAVPCAILAFGFYFSSLHQVTALGIAFAEKSRLVAYGWSGAAVGSFLLGLWLVPRFGAAGAAWCMVAVYAGLAFFYALCSQRLHPLPFRLVPIAVQLVVGLSVVVLAYGMERRPLAPDTFALKVLWFSIMSGVALFWGGADRRHIAATIAGMMGRLRGRATA